MKFKLMFTVVILLAAVLRLWNLSNFPAGFNADEAAIGYNVYSLLLTGKDEYGTSWPLAFQSFGDFKPGGYFYMVMPFVATLGLNEWAVRLPSALLGIGTVILIFFLAKEIFNSSQVGIISSLLLAISPWHIHFSRGGWETNAATFFITLSVLLFITASPKPRTFSTGDVGEERFQDSAVLSGKALESLNIRKPWTLIPRKLIKGLSRNSLIFWSLISFLASMYIYQSPRLIVPVLLLFLFIAYRRILLKIKIKKIVLSSLILVILTIPLMLQFTRGEGGARFAGLSFLSDLGPVSRVNELRGEHQDPNSLLAKLEHNKITSYGSSFLGHYLDHYKPDFLFINGDPLIRNKIPETGQFYLIEALFLVVGLISLKRKSPHTKLLVIWVLVAPIASSITYQTPHALRALNMVIPLTLIISLGLWALVNSIGKKWRIISVGVISLMLIFELAHYIESYYVHSPKRFPLAFEYGFKEMVGKLAIYESKYKKIVITDRYDQPYILLLFYKKYDPAKYQPQAILSPRDKFNFGTVRNFDKYEFRSINPIEIKQNENTLFIITEQELGQNANIIDKVDFPNGEPAFIFVESEK